MKLTEWMGVVSQKDLKRKIRYLGKKVNNKFANELEKGHV